MSKPCPLYGKAIYLDCLECEAKPCKAPIKKRHVQALVVCSSIDLLIQLRTAHINAFGFCKAKHISPDKMAQMAPYLVKGGKLYNVLQCGSFTTLDGKEHKAPNSWDCVIAVLNSYKLTSTHSSLLRGDAGDRCTISNVALYNAGLKALSTLRDVAMCKAKVKIIITPELSSDYDLPIPLQSMRLQKAKGIQVRYSGPSVYESMLKPNPQSFATFGILQRATTEYPKIVEVIKQYEQQI